LVTAIKEARKLHYYKVIRKSGKKMQTTWKVIKKETAKNQWMDNPTQIQRERAK
jgi:hypothetical protein